MTNTEALVAALEILGVTYSDAAIAKALADGGLVGSATYSSGKAFDMIEMKVLTGMLMLTSESEGGYSKTYSLEGLKFRLWYLQDLYGISRFGAARLMDKSYLMG